MTKPVLPLLRDNYTTVAKELFGALLEMLGEARAVCDGDLEKFYIVTVIAMRTVEDRRFAALSPEEVFEGVREYPSLTTNIRSISDSTGIPKETVRRKVAALVRDGWILNNDNQLSLARRPAQMMAEIRAPLLNFSSRVVEAVQSLEPDADDR